MSRKPRILCVDDRADNLNIRTMLLEQFGCETLKAGDCQSALRIVSEGGVDLLVIDYHLSGDETGEILARDVRIMYPRIPLVMLTGDSSLPESACQSVDAVLIKGASNPGALLDLIEKLLPDASLRPRRPMLVQQPQSQGGPKKKIS